MKTQTSYKQMMVAGVVLGIAMLARHALAVDPGVTPYTPDANTAVLYHLNDTNGSLTAADASVNGLTLTAKSLQDGLSSTPFIGTSGPLGLSNAASIFPAPTGGNANNRRILVRESLTPTELGYFNLQTFTIEAWVQNPRGTADPFVDELGIFQLRQGNTAHIGFDFTPTMNLRLFLRDSSSGFFSYATSSPLTFQSNIWYHLAVTYSGDGVGNDSVIKLYSNPTTGAGSPTLLQTFTGVRDIKVPTAGNLEIGGFEGLNRRTIGGDIDEVRYYNDVLTDFNLYIPEPTSVALIATGGLVLFARRMRR